MYLMITWGRGLQTVYDMAVAKLTVALGVKDGGGVLLNADCDSDEGVANVQ